MPLPAIEIETATARESAAAFSVIWLHGLGADGSDFAPVVPLLGLDRQPGLPGVRFVFPHAPAMPVTINGGAVMPAWYDILASGPDFREIEQPSLLASVAAVRGLVAREARRGVPAERVFVAGFSQGGALAYAAGLTHPEPLAGIVALSAYLPCAGWLLAEMETVGRPPPVLAAHGSADEVVAPALGERARDELARRGLATEWRTFPIGHTVSPGEIKAVGAWLRGRIEALAGR